MTLMYNRKVTGKEAGFATIIVAITLVIILSLLTLGFAQLMRNEQNQTTNRQLSNQAYYAAESGLNDALRALSDAAKEGKVVQKDFCGTTTGHVAPTGTSANGWKDLEDNNVDTTSADKTGADQWTCLTIDPFPSSLEYSPVDTVTPTVFTAEPVDDQGNLLADSTINLTIQWKDADNSPTPAFQATSGVSSDASTGAFPQSWKDGSGNPIIGMVRLSVTPLTDLSRTGLTANTDTAYLYPSTATGGTTSAAYSNTTANKGQLLDGGCNKSNTPFYCSATITGIPLPPGGGQFMVTLRSIYAKTHVYITAQDGSGVNVRMKGAQILVDSTGRSQDVLKRIQARTPVQSHYDYPGFVVDSLAGICKHLSVYPGYASGCGYP